MRTGVLLLVGLGLLCGAACSASTSADLLCISAGGVCLATATAGSCLDHLPEPCDTGYVCCTIADGAAKGTTKPKPADGH